MRYCCALVAILMYVHHTFSHNPLYSFSGSIIMTSIPLSKYLSTSSFTKNDLPAPDVASTTLFIFSSLELNLSNITNHPVCVLTPYRIHDSCTRSLATNGKLPANDDVIELLTIPNSSVHNGNPLLNHSSIL